MNLKTFTFSITVLCPLFAAAQIDGYKATYYADGNVEKEQYRSNATIESVSSESSAMYATNGVKLNVAHLHINKTIGVTTNTSRRENGVNSAVLIDGGSTVRMDFCDANSHSAGSDCVTALGEGTKVTVYQGVYKTSRSGCAVFNAGGGASMSVNEAQMETYSGQSPSFYTTKGGNIDVIKCRGTNSGQAAPMFQSSGNITAKECYMTSSKWTMGSVDGGSLTLAKNHLASGGVSGFLVYGAKERSEGGSLNLIKNYLTVGEGPLFLVTNTSAEIIMIKNKVNYKNDEVMSVRSDDWGEKGKNGGNAVLTLEDQSLKGAISVDSISSLNLVLNKGGKLNGQINKTENRCAEVRVVLNKGSQWKSKGNSYVTSVEFDGPVEKGLKRMKGKHTIYYDASDPKNASLEGKTYKKWRSKLCPL